MTPAERKFTANFAANFRSFLKKDLTIRAGSCIIFVVEHIAELCKGSTTDSDSVCWGSNPYSAAKKKQAVLRAACFLVYGMTFPDSKSAGSEWTSGGRPEPRATKRRSARVKSRHSHHTEVKQEKCLASIFLDLKTSGFVRPYPIPPSRLPVRPVRLPF